MDPVTKALIAARKKAGMSQRELAHAIGISQPTLALIELGRRRLHPRHLPQLPEPIRAAVIEARQRALIAEITALDALR